MLIVSVYVNEQTEPDLVAWLEQQRNKSEAIKQLIRAKQNQDEQRPATAAEVRQIIDAALAEKFPASGQQYTGLMKGAEANQVDPDLSGFEDFIQ